jgi:hypothetical protein
MTNHLSSRVLWNWRKRERGKEALPCVRVWNAARRDSAFSERENIGNSTSLLRASTLEGTRRNESLPPQEAVRNWTTPDRVSGYLISVENTKDPSGGLRYAVAPTHHRNRTSQPDALYLAQCNFVLCPVVELGRSRRLMPGHLLGVLQSSVVLQVNRDTGSPPGVTPDGCEKTRRLGPLANRRPGIVFWRQSWNWLQRKVSSYSFF